MSYFLRRGQRGQHEGAKLSSTVWWPVTHPSVSNDVFRAELPKKMVWLKIVFAP